MPTVTAHPTAVSIPHPSVASELPRADTSRSASGPSAIDTFERVGEPRNSTQASNKLTALQKHVMFFDQDGDGKITVGETFDGLRELGFGYTRSSAFAFAINAGLGVATGAPW